MDAGTVREGVGAHHGLVRRNGDAEHVGDQAAGSVELARLDAGAYAEIVAARAERHHHFLERGVAGPFADAVDSALHLARAVANAGERVGHGQAQIVVAVDADDGPRDIRHILPDGANQRAELLRHGIARGVRNVDDGGAGVDDGLEHLEQVGRIGAAGVFGVELDVVGVLAGQLDRVDRHLHELGPLLRQRLAVLLVPELAHDVDVRDADPGVDARALGLGQRFAAGLDIARHRAGQGADDGALDLAGDELHGLEVLRRRGRIARLDDVDVQPRQLPGDGQLLPASETGAGRLLAISQRRVEYSHLIGHRALLPVIREDQQRQYTPATRGTAKTLTRPLPRASRA